MTHHPPIVSLYEELAIASRVLAAQGVLDSFGHVSARHPVHADRFIMPRRLAPALVGVADMVEMDLRGRVCDAADLSVPAERAIHAAIYRTRTDVMSVCHHHAAPILPFCITATPLVPVCHVGAAMGEQVPLWDSRDDFGDTDLLVVDAAQGDSLARALGPWWTVLMRGHGATVTGRGVREMVFRSIHGVLNAEVLLEARRLGPVTPLSPGETAAAAALNLSPVIVDRAWQLWTASLPSADVPLSTSGGSPS